MLGPSHHLGFDACGLERLAQPGAHRAEERLALLALGRDTLRDLLVRCGLEGLETQVLELALDARHAEPVRERRVDVEGLGRDPLHLFRFQVFQRAHVVEPVRELDEDDAQVAGHGQQHLAEVLGLLRAVAVEVEP